ncbi:Hsp70 family protein, partial [Candidatus Woesearchaeota archaeon]|nr:Hsp70 family protein [Candidatus Woesearchaeota archaeon]
VNVSAKDLGTGKQQQITVTGSTKLSEEDVQKMKKEAESHAEEDKKKKEEVEIINKADTMIYTTEKTMKDMEGKVDKAKLEPVKKHVDELKELMKPEKKDIAKIKAKVEEIEKFAQEAATEMYQKAAAEQAKKQQAAGKAGPQPGAKTEEKKQEKKDDNVVDADYEVKDDKKKK